GKRPPESKAAPATSDAGPSAPGKPVEDALDFDRFARVLAGVNSPVLAAACAPDGRTIAVADESQTVQIRSLPGGEVLHTLKGHADAISCLAFAPDGKTLATGSADKLVKLWDVGTGKERAVLA